MARSWCKVSASLDSHPKIRRAGNLGRQVFEFTLRRNAELDRNGIVPSDHLESEYLADVLMLTKEQAVSGLSQCVRTGLLARDNGNFVICGWDDEWGKRPMTEAERKRNQRANRPNSTSVTKCHDAIVTERDSPECHGSEERRGEEIRREEKRVETPTRKRAAKHQLDPLWLPADSEPNRRAVESARARGVDPAQEILKLHDWALAKAATGADWDARWRLWLRSAQPSRRPYAPPKTPLELQLERVDMLEARDRALAGKGTAS